MRRHSPYNYSFDNPIRFIDPDGMGPTDVILGGNNKGGILENLYEAVKTELNLGMNSITGKLVVTQLDPNQTLSAGAQQLLDASLDPNINVNVTAMDGGLTSTNRILVAGAFMGNKVTPGENGGPNKVEAFQEINMLSIEHMDSYYNKPGTTTLHEVDEAYVEAKNSQKSGKSAAAGSDKNPDYDAAHNGAGVPQSGDIYEKALDKNGNQTSNPKKMVGSIYYVEQPGMKREPLMKVGNASMLNLIK